jgi:hypothetical protein
MLNKYNIRPRSYEVAKKLGVKIAPSTRKHKKIDVFVPVPGRPGHYRYKLSVGDLRYLDFHLWKSFEDRGKVPPGTAEKRRKAYKARHYADLNKPGTAGFYAYRLLWF